MKSVYIGNIVYSASEEDMRKLFGQFGEVISVKLINDRETGRPKGFGFVEMDDTGALKAIEALNNTDYMGRNLRVNEARPRKQM
ncbi:RNA-binding protein [Helicobacter monodelphidis]|uniref:RNA recognition motif domain-containing protein n=1 Tax=Helicobacter sp. 15-1451 TaxID=2004995 RepID=UPI000DCC703B|nr:RNA-binding protein [Helicobacter sp. 15-1451]RAX58148.1 RNA-binding protein [Helicobacter sp. 15-1451]